MLLKIKMCCSANEMACYKLNVIRSSFSIESCYQQMCDFVVNLLQDDPIDWNEPILFQVPKLGDRYFEWVHRPTDGHLRLMKSEVCEFFSQCPWYVVPLVWIPIVLLMLYTSYTNLQEEPCSFAVSITKGSVFSQEDLVFTILSWAFAKLRTF